MKNPLLTTLAAVGALAIWVGCETTPTPALAQPVPLSPPAPEADTNLAATNPAAAGSLVPGPNDPRILYVTARLLEQYHYLQRPLDTELSGRFFDNYLNTLDYRHENFLQSDLDEFSHFRTNLDRLTLDRNAISLEPAFAIYARFVQRIQQHNDYVNELLKADKFKLNATDDKIVVDRHQAPFPKTLEEAQALWSQRLRYEYLQEVLSRRIVITNDTFKVVKLTAENRKDITDTLTRHYRWNLHMTTNLDSDRVLLFYVNSLTRAYDPHSEYFSAPRAQDFSISMNLGLFGIGAQLTQDDGYCTIKMVMPGGPAARSKKLFEGDRILAVAQGGRPPVNVVDMDLEKVVQQIRGPKGTEVRLTISPKADRTERKIITLIRDEVKLDAGAAKAKLVAIPDGQGGTNRLGVLDLPSFYAPIPGSDTTPRYTSVDVAKLINRLKKEKISGLIVDLRSNPGGSLEEAIRFTGLFIKDGPVVLARDPDGKVTVDSDPDPTQLYDGPLSVMINRFSASASEIAAAALQDYGRAIVIGDFATHGKGTVQSLFPLRPFVWPANKTDTNDPGTAKITIRKFYRVNGASTQLKGVASDITLPDVRNHAKRLGESGLDFPLPWDVIPAEDYQRLHLTFHQFDFVQPYLEQLKAASDTRVATNQDFLYVAQDIKQFQKNQDDKAVAINERDAIKEKERLFNQARARDAERLARKPSGIRVYEITLKNVDDPGLKEYQPEADTADNTALNEDDDTLFTGSAPVAKETTPETDTNTVDTNTVKTAAAKKTPPPFDPWLEETERIMLDYIPLLTKPGGAAAHN